MKRNKLIGKITAITLVAALSIGGVFYTIKSKADSIDSELKAKSSAMLLDETNYEKEFAEVQKELEANKQTYSFKGVDNLDIYAESHKVDNAKGAIVMAHGYTESVYTFYEMAHYFNQMGYNVYINEHRGHARSGRLGCDDTQIYVEHFDDYIKDFNTFIEQIVKPESNGLDLYGYGHSMGGLIVTKYSEMYPDALKKIVATSPMLGINSGNYPEGIAKIISKVAASTFWAKKYCPGQGPWSKEKDTFANSDALSEVRFNALTLNPKLNDPQMITGDTSYKWLAESYNAISNTLNKKNIAKIKSKIFMTQGIKDTVVDNKGQDKFAASAKTCTLKKYNCKHSIHKCGNDIMDEFLYDVLDFYENK